MLRGYGQQWPTALMRCNGFAGTCSTGVSDAKSRGGHQTGVSGVKKGMLTQKQQMARAKLVVHGSRGRNSELLLSDDHYKATVG